MTKTIINKISEKEALNKFKLESAQDVGVPFKERTNENVRPSKNASVSVTNKKDSK